MNVQVIIVNFIRKPKLKRHFKIFAGIKIRAFRHTSERKVGERVSFP